MCDRLHSGLVYLQMGENFKVQCPLSTAVYFTCGPRTDPPGKTAIVTKGPVSLTMIMDPGSGYVYTTSGGVNLIDVTCNRMHVELTKQRSFGLFSSC